MQKYELTENKKTLSNGVVITQIKALIDIPLHGVNAGDLGGWIGSEDNLSQAGDCWIVPQACVFGWARIAGNNLINGFDADFANWVGTDSVGTIGYGRVSK